ncbi:DoxX family protein [Rickettsia endosymbiont of Cardiosporidium cionae]|uniref:DoxX family protein n=1 Tax=Rickettsia endosymbiont of Cardiosporidium cionae TaxID=2777155 RepID=UPI0018940DF0|nr:DoxX family protein [Rickettsia endosymbiont of Cardiosporidium cionae]KAF8818537.1 hypothetical protein IHI24_000253 [Rickettsia endosymbiont of Cardiosporidium cionae]
MNNSVTKKIRQFYCIYQKITKFSDIYLMGILMLVSRIWMARVFGNSGLNKLLDWDVALYLFEYEYKIPFLPYYLSAVLATATEITCSVALMLGIFSRLFSIPLLILTIVIQFTYLNFLEHFYWALILSIIIFYGPGIYSVDYIIKSKLKHNI